MVMNQNPLIDSLTSHISLYSSYSISSNPNSSSNSRSLILKWFSSLNVHQRQSHLTCVDFKFVQVVIHMLGKLRARGHGFFIVLPDLPSDDPPHLPSTCFKRSSGLLTRIALSNEFEKTIFESARLFSSTDGEKLEECSCSVNNVDSLTLSEDFVADVDRFVEVMDGVSNGRFLRGEDSELGPDWVELNWLKEKGYYSMEAFIANRLEVALRLAWMNSNNVKKRGLKLKEKATAAGIVANVFWRKKGCLDWWTKLDNLSRRKIMTVVLGKSAKSLTHDILRWESGASADEIWLFKAEMERSLGYLLDMSTPRTHQKLFNDSNKGLNTMSAFCSVKPTSISDDIKRLYVLQCIVQMYHHEYDKDNLFFSTFGSIYTISDCIFRKLRGLLMVISLNCTKLELLGEVGNKTSKSKKKSSSSGHRKKGKTRGMKSQTSAPRSHEDECPVDRSNKDLNSTVVAHKRKEEVIEPLEIPTVLEMPLDIFKMEHEGGSNEEVHAAPPKNRKRKHKNKNGGLNKLTDLGISVRAAVKSSSSSNSQDPCTKVEKTNDKSSLSAMEKDKVISDIIVSNPSPPSSFCESVRENDVIQSIEDRLIGYSESFSQMGSQFSQIEDNMIENQYSSAGSKNLKSLPKWKKSPPVAVLELDNRVSSEDDSIKSSIYVREPVVTSSLMDKPPRTFDLKRESLLTQRRNTRDIGSLNSWKCSPFEWPSVAPLYFPSFNSPLPPATDRLHLDVGYNWQNHFRQSFVPTLHQARTSSLEGGCSPIITRPLLMSFDWPPVVRSACRLASSISCNYDSAFISRRQSTLQQGLTASSAHLNTSMTDDEKHSADPTDFNDSSNKQDLIDEYDSCWISEEELEVHAVSGMDYNQCFGGGVMYWNPSDHPGTGFSRPPSLSSDDSSWAWREADITRAVDDMVAFSSSYSTNGLTSPTAASFCSPFDPLVSGHQGLSYVIPGSEVPIQVLHSPTTGTETLVEEEAPASLISDVEGSAGESYQYPILRPIVVPNMSRERLASELKCNHDNKSPHVPPSRRERPRIKRPPSPVVLCVPRAPRPPPPSPVGDSRKHRGFPTVRSGSSSPRHWGMKGWLHDGTNTEEGFIRMDGAEVVWPSWRYNNLSTRPMIQPLSAALLKDRLIAMSQLAREQEHPDVAIRLLPPELQNYHTRKESFTMLQGLLHDEIQSFCLHVAAENMAKKPYITWAVKRVTRSIQVLWPRSRTNIFGSNATNLCLPTSDVDLVVCLPPVRNLEPIKEAGILEGRNGIKETCLQHAARCLANQEWVKNDSLKIVENTAIPIIMLVVEVPHEVIASSASNVQSPKEELSGANTDQVENTHSEMVGLDELAIPKCTQINFDSIKDSKSVRLDISFKTPSHTGLQTTELVKQLTEQFPAATPLALVLKQFLADRSLDQSYSGGLSSYCLVLLIIRFLQHEHHLGRPINQNFGRLLMDFLYFFGNVYDPRQMRVSIQGSGVYMKRERGCSIDPIHVDDPLFPMNNVGRNCFRIHQCIKAFADAYSILEAELAILPDDGAARTKSPYRLLNQIIPSITCFNE